jgi:hypothetical protein
MCYSFQAITGTIPVPPANRTYLEVPTGRASFQLLSMMRGIEQIRSCRIEGNVRTYTSAREKNLLDRREVIRAAVVTYLTDSD